MALTSMRSEVFGTGNHEGATFDLLSVVAVELEGLHADDVVVVGEITGGGGYTEVIVGGQFHSGHAEAFFPLIFPCAHKQ